jgi:peptidyl-tRNA hydrolase
MPARVPHQSKVEIIARAAQDDPLVMYYAVPKSISLNLGEAIGLAGAVTVACAQHYEREPSWKDVFEAWYRDSYRKVVLRASESEFRVLKELAHVSVLCPDGKALFCFPPRRKSEREQALLALRPFTDARTRSTGAPAFDEEAVSYIIRPRVMRSMGKAMAQAGHAALMCVRYFADDYSGQLCRWREKGCPGCVFACEDDGVWEYLKKKIDCSYVTDAGLTQVEPGTETMIVVPPGALTSEARFNLRAIS